MSAAADPSAREFDRLDVRSIGLWHLLFQSLTSMGPATALAIGLFIVIPFAGPALPTFIVVALAICLCVAVCLGQMAKHVPSAGGWYAYAARGLGPEAGFLVGWLYLCVIPAVLALLLLSLALVVQDVMVNEKRGLGWEGSPWWLWVVLGAGLVFVLAYRGIRLAMGAAIVLGAIELLLCGALAVWMVVANFGENTIRAFDPGEALGDDFAFYFKGLVLAILVFVGFEGAAPLAEEARDARKNVPRAIVGTTLATGLFVLFGSYAMVVGFGFDEFADASLAAGNPWVELGDIYWDAGWTLIFFAVVNSLVGLVNANVNAASRIVYALGRSDAIPEVFARTHPRYRTPHVAVAATSGIGATAALLAGWKWDLFTAIGVAAVAVTVSFMLIYIAVCISTFAFYRRERGDEFSILLHGLVPLAAVLGLAAVVYYQYRPLPPYPVRLANWLVVAELALGVIALLWLANRRRGALLEAGRVLIDEGAESDSAPVGASI